LNLDECNFFKEKNYYKMNEENILDIKIINLPNVAKDLRLIKNLKNF
jgi:hypothetical protein